MRRSRHDESHTAASTSLQMTGAVRPHSPSGAPPQPLPIRGPMRQRAERLRLEAEAAQRADAAGSSGSFDPCSSAQFNNGGNFNASYGASGDPASRSYAPASLGYGKNHPDHFVYTRNAVRKGVYDNHSSHHSSLQFGSLAAPYATTMVHPQGGAAAAQALNATSADFARTKTRFADEETLPAPQSIGYGRTHAHYFHYVAPIVAKPGAGGNGSQ